MAALGIHKHGWLRSGGFASEAAAQTVLWPVQRRCELHSLQLPHLLVEQHTHNSCSYIYRRHYSSRAAAPARVVISQAAMAETSIPAAAMPAAGVPNEVPAAPSKLPGETPGAPAAAAAGYNAILGTSLALDQIHQVKMHVSGKCSMGISFWPKFGFTPPEREPQAGTVTLVENTAAAHPTSSSKDTAAAAAGSEGGGGSSGAAADVVDAPAAAGEGGTAGASSCSCSHLLHINFTRDPPDEVSTGAKLLGCIPFPFLTIRTNKLEGTIDPCSGAVRLEFEAAMLAQVGSRPATPLLLSTCLTSEPSTAYKVTLEGQRMADGRVTLVSAAEVPKTGSSLANIILWLPTAATAILPMRLEFLQ